MNAYIRKFNFTYSTSSKHVQRILLDFLVSFILW